MCIIFRPVLNRGRVSSVAQMVKNLPAMHKTQVQFLGQDPETVTTLFVIFYTPTQNRKFKKKKENFKLKKERDFQPI